MWACLVVQERCFAVEGATLFCRSPKWKIHQQHLPNMHNEIMMWSAIVDHLRWCWDTNKQQRRRKNRFNKHKYIILSDQVVMQLARDIILVRWAEKEQMEDKKQRMQHARCDLEIFCSNTTYPFCAILYSVLDTYGHYPKCTENRGLKELRPLFSDQHPPHLAL